MTHDDRSTGTPELVIVGGGVAALEALMALRALAEERMRITLVAQDADFVYRPMAVTEPFGKGAPRRHPLSQVAAEFDARFIRAKVIAVEAAQRRVILASGDTRSYDMLVLAPGARTVPAFDDAIEFGRQGSALAMRRLVEELEQGAVRRVAFIVPTLVGWALPLYELALMTAGRLADRGLDAELALITPEERPLAIFGTGPSAGVARLLTDAGVEFIGSTSADVQRDVAYLEPGGRKRPIDRAVALPLVRGPQLEGVPAEREYGFIPVDRHGRVAGLEDAYAAGDATDFPVKQGGLATQQADAVAQDIAARLGAPVDRAPFTAVLRGMLFTGGPPRFMSAGLGLDREDEASASSQPLWWPPTKIAGHYLAPYLLERDATEAEAIRRPPEGFSSVEITLTGAKLDPGSPPSAHFRGA